jgi:4-hydroxy-tetrahydrodipicolinate synthase
MSLYQVKHTGNVMITLPKGIVSVVQTAFGAGGRVDMPSIERLVEDAIAAGVDGFLLPVVASEVAWLSRAERDAILGAVSRRVRGRVPIIAGASADTPDECAACARSGLEAGAVASLVAVPQSLYGAPDGIDAFFQEVFRVTPGPVVIQDLQFAGPGMDVGQILRLRERHERFAGIKIETVPAGPKYSEVRSACGAGFWIAGGWAIAQMIEALDRGVDAMVPESAMIKLYKRVYRLYQSGRRGEALALFRRLLPVLAFTNQELATSVAFFKRLLVQKGIFSESCQRMPLPAWDDISGRTSSELIEYYMSLESEAM